jgi:hypothetical protein
MIAADVEEFVVTYLAQSFPYVGVDMPPAPPPPAQPLLPFYLVTRLGGSSGWISDCPLVQIDAFAATRTAASTAARAMHNLMNPWVLTSKIGLALSTGRAFIDSIEIHEAPTWRDYENPNLHRYCGRYRIELRNNQTS